MDGIRTSAAMNMLGGEREKSIMQNMGWGNRNWRREERGNGENEMAAS